MRQNKLKGFLKYYFFIKLEIKMKTVEFNNITFYVGQSAKENWEILDQAKTNNPDYIWFHLNSFPSPYVIMCATMCELENDCTLYLQYGAALCKDHSKYKNFRDLKILYHPIKKITKTSKIGEVTLTGKRKTIKL